jgi:hypothetical protein
MITNYFSAMIDQHNGKKVYELYCPHDNEVYKVHTDLGYLELLRQEKLSTGWSAEIRIKEDKTVKTVDIKKLKPFKPFKPFKK